MTVEPNPPTAVSDPPSSKGSPPFKVSVKDSDEGVILVIEGELDIANAPALGEALVQVADGLEGDLILDIRSVSFIGSSGLTLFVNAHKKLRSLGHELVIVGPTPQTRRLFEIAGLDEALIVRPH